MDQSVLEAGITAYVTPVLALLVSGIIALWFKEMVSDLVASIRWKMKPGFEPVI